MVLLMEYYYVKYLLTVQVRSPKQGQRRNTSSARQPPEQPRDHRQLLLALAPQRRPALAHHQGRILTATRSRPEHQQNQGAWYEHGHRAEEVAVRGLRANRAAAA